jgi:hypothetical protein
MAMPAKEFLYGALANTADEANSRVAMIVGVNQLVRFLCESTNPAAFVNTFLKVNQECACVVGRLGISTLLDDIPCCQNSEIGFGICH